MTAEIKSENVRAALVLTLSDAGLGNALTPGMCAAGIEALNAAERNPDVSCIVLAGANGTFCAGIQPGAADQEALRTAAWDWLETILTFPKPVIAAMEGEARGAGVGIALACDLAVVSETATWRGDGLAGSGPLPGLSWMLAQRLPRPLALQLLCDAGSLDGRRLHALGMANQLCPAGQALNEALKLADALTRLSAGTLAQAKQALDRARSSTLREQLMASRTPRFLV